MNSYNRFLVAFCLTIFISGCASNNLRTTPEIEIFGYLNEKEALNNRVVFITAMTDARATRNEFFFFKETLEEQLSKFDTVSTPELLESNIVAILDFETDWHADGFEKALYLDFFGKNKLRTLESQPIGSIRIKIIDEELDVIKALEQPLRDTLEKINVNQNYRHVEN